MAAYWSTLAYQSRFEPSRYFGQQQEARAFDHGFYAEFLGAEKREAELLPVHLSGHW